MVLLNSSRPISSSSVDLNSSETSFSSWMVGWKVRRVFPRLFAASARPLGPKTRSATTPITRTSGVPTPSREAFVRTRSAPPDRALLAPASRSRPVRRDLRTSGAPARYPLAGAPALPPRQKTLADDLSIALGASARCLAAQPLYLVYETLRDPVLNRCQRLEIFRRVPNISVAVLVNLLIGAQGVLYTGCQPVRFQYFQESRNF